jgi:hypothetical protein
MAELSVPNSEVCHVRGVRVYFEHQLPIHACPILSCVLKLKWHVGPFAN